MSKMPDTNEIQKNHNINKKPLNKNTAIVFIVLFFLFSISLSSIYYYHRTEINKKHEQIAGLNKMNEKLKTEITSLNKKLNNMEAERDSYKTKLEEKISENQEQTENSDLPCQEKINEAKKLGEAYIALDKNKCNNIDECLDIFNDLYILKEPKWDISEENRLLFGYDPIIGEDEFPSCQKGRITGQDADNLYCRGGVRVETEAVIDDNGKIKKPEHVMDYWYDLELEETGERTEQKNHIFIEAKIVDLSCKSEF